MCTLGLAALSAHSAPAPKAAAEAGFTVNTFSTEVFAPQGVDQAASYAPGRQWYLWNFFGKLATPERNQLLPDGSDQNFGVSAGQIATAAQVSDGFVGTAFGGGGYFEAEIAFDAAAVVHANGWPAWWAMSLEHLIGRGDQWAGQPGGYRHFIEVDAFEYDRPTDKPLQYGATLHDWYGLFGRSCPGPGATFCAADTSYRLSTKTAPAGTDWSKFHKVAFLWTPATMRRQGSITFYLDGRQMGDRVAYDRAEDQPPPPKGKRWAFGVIDRQHLVLILGGSPSGMRIRSVNAWQRSAAENLTR